MAYDEELADRIRSVLGQRPGMSERKMFGGIGFMLDGNMCCGVIGDELMLRLGDDAGTAAMRRDDVRAFDMTGRPMTGWVLVAAESVATEEQVAPWVDDAAAFVATLPPKT